MKRIVWISLAFCVFLMGGCGIGKNTMLFSTNTSIGVDVDTDPPRTSFAYSRSDGVIAPDYPGAEVPPVISTVQTKSDVKFSLTTLAPEMGFSNNQSFATGDAAVLFAKGLKLGKDVERTDTSPSSEFTVDNLKQDEKNVVWGLIPGLGVALWEGVIWRSAYEKNEKRPYYFATNTNFGLDVKYATNCYPRAINLGLKRQEVALVPISEITPQNDIKTEVKVPSLLGVFGANAKVKTESGISVGQIFATGKAADFLAGSQHARDGFLGNAILGENYDYVKKNIEMEDERYIQKGIGGEIVKVYKKLNDDQKSLVRNKAHDLQLITIKAKENEDEFIKDIQLGRIDPKVPDRTDRMTKLLQMIKDRSLFKIIS